MCKNSLDLSVVNNFIPVYKNAPGEGLWRLFILNWLGQTPLLSMLLERLFRTPKTLQRFFALNSLAWAMAKSWQKLAIGFWWHTFFSLKFYSETNGLSARTVISQKRCYFYLKRLYRRLSHWTGTGYCVVRSANQTKEDATMWISDRTICALSIGTKVVFISWKRKKLFARTLLAFGK